MKRFIEGENRFQSTLFPESLDDYIAKDNAVRNRFNPIQQDPTAMKSWGYLG